MASRVASRALSTRRHSLLTKCVSAVGGGTFVGCAYAYQVERRAERAHDASTNHASSSSSTNADVPVLPREYDSNAVERYWEKRPVTVAFRVVDALREAAPILASYLYDFHVRPRLLVRPSDASPSEDDGNVVDDERSRRQRRHASNLREALTRLGPAFVKLGQQLSIRPDLVPPAVLRELRLLCDSVPPVDDEVALRVLSDELCLDDPSELRFLFEGLELVAAASLGQVYRATLVDTKERVAIKVQRPDMLRRVSLDLFLLSKIARLADRFTGTFTEQAPYHVNLFDTFARGSYLELDYENEAANQLLFRKEFRKRDLDVLVPDVHLHFSSRRVITTEWVDGTKLADADRRVIRRLIPIGVELFLTQLLDVGRFHADPHPGNLYVTDVDVDGGGGRLCLLDFGLCARVDARDRRAMTAAIVHLLVGDFDRLVSEDAVELGFLPRSMDTTEIRPVLKTILTRGLLESGSNLRERKRRLAEISDELNEVFFRYPFSVPPFFALVTRGLGLLEGIALSGDPDFDIFQASYPYASKRAVEIFGQHGINQMRRRMTTRQTTSDHTSS